VVRGHQSIRLEMGKLTLLIATVHAWNVIKNIGLQIIR